ncbi:MAG: hypothetical protein SW833_01155 [Cyanobacteriota bacterium]|nr:hypothetical protein [Cyanobacteriota bacterium]
MRSISFANNGCTKREPSWFVVSALALIWDTGIHSETRILWALGLRTCTTFIQNNSKIDLELGDRAIASGKAFVFRAIVRFKPSQCECFIPTLYSAMTTGFIDRAVVRF